MYIQKTFSGYDRSGQQNERSRRDNGIYNLGYHRLVHRDPKTRNATDMERQTEMNQMTTYEKDRHETHCGDNEIPALSEMVRTKGVANICVALSKACEENRLRVAALPHPHFASETYWQVAKERLAAIAEEIRTFA